MVKKTLMYLWGCTKNFMLKALKNHTRERNKYNHKKQKIYSNILNNKHNFSPLIIRYLYMQADI